MSDVLSHLRTACAAVADRARYVHVEHERIRAYIGTLPIDLPASPDPEAHMTDGSREELAAFWLTLDAINFGSGWFPTLRKPGGRSGYFTIATALKERFTRHGPWSAQHLAEIDSLLWHRGQEPRYKAVARHRSHCTAY